MSEPEIARRCPSCGASIREAALFCPQCGKALPPRNTGQPQPPVTVALPDETISINAAIVGSPGVEPGKETLGDSSRVSGQDPKKQTQPLQNKPAVNPPAVKAAPSEKARVGQAALGAVGAKIQRATTLARDVEGNVMHRARKVREISSVVLDEAGYDPSLRFVLVAAVLFLLFLVIVLLNKFIT